MRMNGNDLAFPAQETEQGSFNPGLTKREYAAIQIMAALKGAGGPDSFYSNQGAAMIAVQAADALIEELSK